MMKKKKQNRSQSSSKKSLVSSPDSSPSPRLLSVIRSKLASGKDLKNMFRGMRSKTVPGLSSQSRIVRCPNCQKLLQEPLDATSYKCGGCDSILHAKRLELEDNVITIPKALLSSQSHSLGTEVESAEGGTHREYKSRASASVEYAESGGTTPLRSTHREYKARASASVERGSHSKTVYKHETSDIRREWMRRANEFSATGDSDLYNSHSNVSKWPEQDERYEDLPPVPFYPASPSPSSAYEYGYNSPYHGSHVSASEQSYYHHNPNQFKQSGREGWFQEFSGASPIRFPGESDGKYYQWSSQSQLHDLQYRNLYESSSSATHAYSERSYQASAAPYRSTYSEKSMGIAKSETSSDKSSSRDKNRYARERKPVVKRHVLPLAGGAPFATCSYCLELIQLPQVSLHGKHNRYQVRCGSCSGVLKLSIGEKADNVLDSPSLVESGTGFAEETVAIQQDSTSEGHEEMHPDESHLSCSDNDSGDTTCKSNDHVVLSRSLETFAEKGNNEMHQHAPSETIRETSRIHLEQSKEAHSEMLHEMAKEISEGVGYDLEESGYEKNEILNPDEVVGDGSGELLSELLVYKKEMMSESSLEVETVAERLISHSAEPINKNENVCETQVLSEHTQELDWKETKKEGYGSESTWEEIMGSKSGLHLEKSQYAGDFIYDSSSSNNETFEDRTVKEDTGHISNTFSDVAISGEVTAIISRIHGNQPRDNKLEESQYEYENLSKSQELDKAISHRVRYELDESLNETNETLELDMLGEDESVVSTEKGSETFKSIIEGETAEERLVPRQMDPRNETVENSYATLEQVYLQGSGYAGERSWAETEEARAGLHLEEYESNYENYSKPLEWTSETAPTFPIHEYELGSILEPEEDADGRSESSSSFSDHESSEENAVFHESQDAEPDQSQYEYENSNERSELSNTVFDIVRSESEECRYNTNETLEPGKRVGVGSIVSLEKASETIIDETGEERSVTHQTKPQENVENSYGTVEAAYLEGNGYTSERIWEETMGDGTGLELEECESNYENYCRPLEWTSETDPTFHMHEYELGTIPEPEEDADGRLESSSRSSFSDHESSEENVVSRESQDAKPDQAQYEYENSNERQEWSNTVFDIVRSESQECRYKTNETLEPGKMVGVGSIVSLEKASETIIGETSEERSVNHQRNPQKNVENSYGTVEPAYLEGSGYVSERIWEETMGDGSGLELKECESNPFEWTSLRAPTFRLHEYEQGIMSEADEDANGGPISGSRNTFVDHESLKDKVVYQEKEPWIVNENEIEAVKVGETMEDGPLHHLENCGNESTVLEETFEWTSERAPTLLHEYELGTTLESDEDVESNSRGSFSNHESSKVRDLFHEELQLVNDIRTDEQYIGEMVEDGPTLLLEKCENELQKLDETFEWTAGRALTFRLHDNELETMLKRYEDADGVSESSSRGSFQGSSNERTMNHEEELLLVDDSETGALKISVITEDQHLKKGKNEAMELDDALEPRDDIFRLSPHNTVEQENMMFHLEMSEDKQSLEEGKAQEEKLESGSMVSLEGHETSSKMAEEDSEAEEETLGDDLEKKENDKSRLTSEPYPRLYCRPETFEVVGLRHALYETQTSPLTSPIHTPIGSPLHYLMSSQIRSPIPSPMHSHIVSPLRSPIISSGSLSDVLFFKLDDRKTDKHSSKLA